MIEIKVYERMEIFDRVAQMAKIELIGVWIRWMEVSRTTVLKDFKSDVPTTFSPLPLIEILPKNKALPQK